MCELDHILVLQCGLQYLNRRRDLGLALADGLQPANSSAPEDWPYPGLCVGCLVSF